MQGILQSHQPSPDGTPMAARASAATLSEVLARPDIWRGDALAAAPKPGVPTGFATLDAELPGGGWPRGAVVELMARHDGIGGIGEMALLMPALTSLAAKNARWIVCVAPPMLPFAAGWSGVPLQRLMVVRARGDDAAWVCAQALDTEGAGVGAVLVWLPNSRAATLRRLQLLAERSDALVFVFRPSACASQSSPAPLRLMLEVGDGVSSAPTDNTLAVHLLKRRGAGRVAPLYLNVSRPRRESRESQESRESFGLPGERMPARANYDVVAESVIPAVSA